jgi:hypothetical protein
MPTMYDDVDALCPFFRSSEKRKIICDGVIEDCTTQILFKTIQSRNLHRRIFCDRKYMNCEYYQVLEKCCEE